MGYGLESWNTVSTINDEKRVKTTLGPFCQLELLPNESNPCHNSPSVAIIRAGFGQEPATRHSKAVDSTADTPSLPAHVMFRFEKRQTGDVSS